MFPVVFQGHWTSMPVPLFWKYELSYLLFSYRSIPCLYSTVDLGCSRLSKSLLHGSPGLTTSSLENGSPAFVQIGYLQDFSQSKVYRHSTTSGFDTGVLLPSDLFFLQQRPASPTTAGTRASGPSIIDSSSKKTPQMDEKASRCFICFWGEAGYLWPPQHPCLPGATGLPPPSFHQSSHHRI